MIFGYAAMMPVLHDLHAAKAYVSPAKILYLQLPLVDRIDSVKFSLTALARGKVVLTKNLSLVLSN
jgi:hypothetical protein